MIKNQKLFLFILLSITAIFLLKLYSHKSWKDILNYSQKWDADTYNKYAFAQYDISIDALSHWPFKGNENVLDIGCGVGSISAVIAKKYVPNGSVLGIDLSEDMINFAKKTHNLKNLKFESMNASDVCYLNEFDLITSFYCIHWIKDQQAFLDNAVKCLKPGGKILFYIMTEIEKYILNEVLYKVITTPKWANHFKDYQIPWYFKTEQEFAQIVKNSGLTLTSIETVGKKIIFKDIDSLTSWVKAIPFASHLEPNLRKDILKDLMTEYLKLVPMNKDGSIEFILPTLIVTAEKKSKTEGVKLLPEYNEKFMKRAIELSKEASIIKKTGGVFGAVIVKDGKIIGEGYNQVIKQNDPTWHGEIEAIRQACKKLKTPHLTGCILYTSAECCPMCLTAAYWAHIEHIYYAATTADALKYGDFKDIDFLKQVCMNPADRVIKSTQKMQKEAVAVWKEFSEMPDRARY